jgi:hypothetical protein
VDRRRVRARGAARIGLVVLAAAAAAAALAGCGGPSGAATSGTATEQTTTTAPGATTTTVDAAHDDAVVPVVADPPVLDPPTRPGGDGPIGPDLPDVPTSDEDVAGTDGGTVTVSDDQATASTSRPATGSTASTAAPVQTGTGSGATTTTADDGHRQVSVLELQVGMCFLDPGRATAGEPTEVAELEVLPCDEEHDHEVVALWNDPAGPAAPFPGRTALVAAADCTGRLADYAGVDPLTTGLEALPITPEAATWSQGDRAVGCYAHRFDGAPTTGSLRTA